MHHDKLINLVTQICLPSLWIKFLWILEIFGVVVIWNSPIVYYNAFQYANIFNFVIDSRLPWKNAIKYSIMS